MKYRILPVTTFQQNCSLIWDEQTMEGALIDPGGDVEHLLALAKQAGVTLTKLLLTHGHIDHVGGALAIARQLVQAHGGKIDVESQTGQGTTFTIELPQTASNPL